MAKLKNGFFANGFFILGDKREIEYNRFFRDSNELAKFIHKMLNKYDEHPSIYFTASIYRYFRKFERVNRVDPGRGADEFENILEHGEEYAYIPSGNGCFLKCNNFIIKRNFTTNF